MEILCTQAITRVKTYPKVKDYDIRFVIRENYKKRIGRKFLFFPVYETPHDAVVRWWSGDYFCPVSEFNHKELFIEDGEFFRKPHCRIFMNDKSSKDVYFETIDELDIYINRLKGHLDGGLIFD